MVSNDYGIKKKQDEKSKTFLNSPFTSKITLGFDQSSNVSHPIKLRKQSNQIPASGINRKDLTRQSKIDMKRRKESQQSSKDSSVVNRSYHKTKYMSNSSIGNSSIEVVEKKHKAYK